MKKTLIKQKIYIYVFIMLLSITLVVPSLAKADTDNLSLDTIVELMRNAQQEDNEYGPFPASGERTPRRIVNALVTGYSSDIWQCDSTPFTPAMSNYNLKTNAELGIVDTVAANFLPLGTKVRFPDLFGDKVFTVRDRMNAKYNGTTRVDIYFALLNADGKLDAKTSRQAAVTFGVKRLKMEVF